LTWVFVRDVAAGTTSLLSAVRADAAPPDQRASTTAEAARTTAMALAAAMRDALVCPLAGSG
jgi:hypothetical protein